MKRSFEEAVATGRGAKDISEVECLTMRYYKLKENNNFTVVSMFNVCNEGGTVRSKNTLREHASQIMQLVKTCITIDPSVKHTKYDSPICSLLCCVVT